MSNPLSVFCDQHDEHAAVFTKGRPLLDDTCPACNLDLLRVVVADLRAWQGDHRLCAAILEDRVRLADERARAQEAELATLREALQFYADPKSHEVQHSKDRDVCNSMRCGCSLSPVSVDEGERAAAALGER